MTLSIIIRLFALCFQFLSIYIIVEYFGERITTVFFPQLSVALVASRLGTLAFPLYAFPLIKAGQSKTAISIAIQIQAFGLPIVFLVLAPLYHFWNMPLWSGITLYIASLLDMNHIFFRHEMVTKNFKSINIIAYESSQPIFFCLILFMFFLIGVTNLFSIILSYTLSMIAMMVIGSILSSTNIFWTLNLKHTFSINKTRLKVLIKYARKALPVCLNQFTQIGAGNFPVFAATICGTPLDVISMALLQRLLSIVEAFTWLDVVRALDIYYIEKAPAKHYAKVIAIASFVTIFSFIFFLISDTVNIRFISDRFMPNIYMHLKRLAAVPAIFLLPALGFINIHLHYIYLGAERFKEQFYNGALSAAVMLFLFVMLVNTNIRLITIISWSYGIYEIAFLFLTFGLMNEALLNIKS